MNHCIEYAQLDRRQFIGSGLTAAGAFVFGRNLLALPGWLPRIALADRHTGPRGDTLVCIFLRGGTDGLNMVVPHGDDAYYAARPRLAIARPDDRGAEAVTHDLDGFFGLHPALAPLAPLYAAGDLAFVHATGSPDETRSHFSAQALMESGAAEGLYTGWLGRHLATLDTGNDSALRALGVGTLLQPSLIGAPATVAQSIERYRLEVRDESIHPIETTLEALYAARPDMLTAAAQQTLDTLDLMRRVQGAGRSRVSYASNELGEALHLVAELIHADVGLEVACIDYGGWDTHANQGGATGLMAQRLGALAQGLAAFYADMATKMDRITVVVMSEFGRRLDENASGGTDHGHGNVMTVLGGSVNGGRVLADWPGLAPEQLVGPGDLAITTDFRDVLSEILSHRLNNPLTDAVFPDYTPAPLDLVRPLLAG